MPAFGLKQVVGGSIEFEMEKLFHVLRGRGVCLGSHGLYGEKMRGDRSAKASPTFSVNLSEIGPGFPAPRLDVKPCLSLFQGLPKAFWGPPLPLLSPGGAGDVVLPLSPWFPRTPHSPAL